MSEMLDRVTGAVVRELDEVIGPNDPIDLRMVARAAIEAMREPTAEMVDAFVPTGADEVMRDFFREDWQAAIDAALGDLSAVRDAPPVGPVEVG